MECRNITDEGFSTDPEESVLKAHDSSHVVNPDTIRRMPPVKRRVPNKFDCIFPENIDKFYTDNIKWYDTMMSGINPFTNRKMKDNDKQKLISSTFGGFDFEYVRNNGMEAYRQYVADLMSIEKKRNVILFENNRKSVIRKNTHFMQWDEFTTYKGIKYGCPKVVQDRHNENDCGGKTRFISVQMTRTGHDSCRYECTICGAIINQLE